jgi:glycosyltransferase involved in cell wall biosynthesis
MIHICDPCKVMIAIPGLFVGGTEIQVLSLARVLIAGGHRVAVCCYYDFDQSIVERFQEAGAEMILLELGRSDGRFGPSKIVKLIHKLCQTFQKYHPDVIHVQYLTPGFIPVLAARLTGVKMLFATVHQPGGPYGLKEKCLLRTAAKLCTAFFCVSQAAEKSWFGDSALWRMDLAKNGRKHFTIYNGVDCERIRVSSDSVDANDLKSSVGVAGKPVVGVVGRLRAEKGHGWLFEAMAEVLKVIPDVFLLVVGDGPDRESLKHKAKNLGISEKVIWMGQKPPDEVYRLYSAMDVVVVPSLFEGFGLTAAEAMAASRPIIASNTDGLVEVMQDRISGFLVPRGNIEPLSKAIIELILNPVKAALMGRRARQKIEKEFSIGRFREAILAAYAHYTGMRDSA